MPLMGFALAKEKGRKLRKLPPLILGYGDEIVLLHPIGLSADLAVVVKLTRITPDWSVKK
jgi:hypothetical protein